MFSCTVYLLFIGVNFKMKLKEKEIIKYLRKGKRVNISEIARELNLPISTVRDRIARIENRYVIKRSSILNYKSIGYVAHAMLAVKIGSEHKFVFLDFLKEQNCVNSIYRINTGFNFMIELIFKDHLKLLNWMEAIKAKFPLEITSFQILKVEKKEGFVPN